MKILKYSPRYSKTTFNQLSISFINGSINKNNMNIVFPFLLKNFMQIDNSLFESIIVNEFKYKWEPNDIKKAMFLYNQKMAKKSRIEELDKYNTIESIYLPENLQG